MNLIHVNVHQWNRHRLNHRNFQESNQLLEECMNKEKELRKQIEINSERIHNIPESEGL